MRSYIKYTACFVLILFLSVCTACQKETEHLVYLETADGSVTPELSDQYYALKDRFPELYKNLYFTVDLPEAAELYDKGSSDGVVRFSDRSGKNLITLETRFKEQYERCYQQYLHDVCASLSDLNSFHEYEEIFEINGFQARRLDFRLYTGTETRLISYWFFDIPESPEHAAYSPQSGTGIVSVESTAENIETMLRIINTFRMRGE